MLDVLQVPRSYNPDWIDVFSIKLVDGPDFKDLLQTTESEFDTSNEMTCLLASDREVELVIMSLKLEEPEPSRLPLPPIQEEEAGSDGGDDDDDDGVGGGPHGSIVSIDIPPRPSLMETRLLQTGLISKDEFSFVNDTVSKEVKDLYQQEDEDDCYNSRTNGNMVTHVKTGVWEVLCHDDDDDIIESRFYVVTAIPMDDRVDKKKFRKAIFDDYLSSTTGSGNGTSSRRPWCKKRHTVVAMAPTHTAENLVGYKSGTMAPICHTTNMRLYVEESIVTIIINADQQQHQHQHHAGTNNSSSADHHHHRLLLHVGSGMVGKCLSIPLDKFLTIASANPEGYQLCPLIQTKKKNKTLNQKETIR